MSHRKKHVLKSEVSENGAIYKERSVDVVAVVLVCIVVILGLVIGGFIAFDFLIPLIQSGAFNHGQRQ